MRTARYRKHHEELEKVAQTISGLLDPAQFEQNAPRIKRNLTRMAALVSIHLAFEDKALYPSLLESSNSAVSTTARRYMEEMSGIQTAFESYLDKYPSTRSILENQETFIRETKELFAVLAARIERENNELYTMVDNL